MSPISNIGLSNKMRASQGMGGGTFGKFAQTEEGKRTGQRQNHGPMKTVPRRVRRVGLDTGARLARVGDNYHDVINPGLRAPGPGKSRVHLAIGWQLEPFCKNDSVDGGRVSFTLTVTVILTEVHY